MRVPFNYHIKRRINVLWCTRLLLLIIHIIHI